VAATARFGTDASNCNVGTIRVLFAGAWHFCSQPKITSISTSLSCCPNMALLNAGGIAVLFGRLSGLCSSRLCIALGFGSSATATPQIPSNRHIIPACRGTVGVLVRVERATRDEKWYPDNIMQPMILAAVQTVAGFISVTPDCFC
jgi:hypothetical protein